MHYFPYVPNSRVVEISAITEYSISEKDQKVVVHVSDGSTLSGFDFVLFGTGYFSAAPFIRVRDASQNNQLLPMPTQPDRIPHLYRHILYVPNPTLAFVGYFVAATPFPLADAASTWLALVWTGEIKPTIDLNWEKDRLDKIKAIKDAIDDPTSFLRFDVLAADELPYVRELTEEVVHCRPALGSVLMDWPDERWTHLQGMFGLKQELLNKSKSQ